MSLRPSYGHYTPMVGLANALRRAGHEVLFATGEPLATTIRRDGFACETVGLSDAETRELRSQDATYTRLNAVPRTARMAAFSRSFAGIELPPRVEDMRRVARAWRPAMIVHELAEFAGPLVAALEDLPSANHSFGPLVQADVMAASAASAARCWADHGLPEPERAGMYRGLYLDIVPPSLQFPHISTIPSVQRLRPIPLALQETGPAVWLERLGDRPVVTVTFGTVFSKQVDLFRTVVDGLGGVDVDVIVATGHSDVARALSDVPANVQVREWVPWTKTLERTAVVVSHGGASSTLGPLAFGIPIVMIPLGADHFTNAEVTAKAGVAIVLDAESVTSEEVRESVQAALRGPMRDAARRVADEIAQMPTPEAVVDVLEAFATR